jgi:hypothetical protein
MVLAEKVFDIGSSIGFVEDQDSPFTVFDPARGSAYQLASPSASATLCQVQLRQHPQLGQQDFAIGELAKSNGLSAGPAGHAFYGRT